MTRREIREQVFILLFQREFYGREPFDEQKETYMETKEWTEKDQAYIEEHMAKIMDKLPEIDELISEHSNGWKLDRIGKEELAILRLAIYEAKFDEEIPVGVAVNEAVELAKTYGEDGGGAFVNGIFGEIVNESSTGLHRICRQSVHQDDVSARGGTCGCICKRRNIELQVS